MCFGIVKQAGGHILVDSRVGRGSRFTVLLPRLLDARETFPPDAPRPPAELRRGSEAVLVVEDDPAVRALAVRTLRDAGYSVVEADGAAAARVAAATVGRLDLVLSDVVMPGEGGPAVPRAVRHRHPRAMVLYMSRYAADGIEALGLPDQQVPFLAKQFTPAALTHAVRAALDARTGPDPAAGQ